MFLDSFIFYFLWVWDDSEVGGGDHVTLPVLLSLIVESKKITFKLEN